MPLINYDIPDDLHRKAKVEAAKRGVTLKALIIEALERIVEDEPERRRRRST